MSIMTPENPRLSFSSLPFNIHYRLRPVSIYEWSSYSALSWQWGLDRSEQFKLRSPALLRQGPRLTLKSPSISKWVGAPDYALLCSEKCHPARRNMSPPAVIDFFGAKNATERLWYRHQSDKNATAAQIDPRSGHFSELPAQTFSIPKVRCWPNHHWSKIQKLFSLIHFLDGQTFRETFNLDLGEKFGQF